MTCNFGALEVIAMYFTFLETSNPFLFGQESRGVYFYEKFKLFRYDLEIFETIPESHEIFYLRDVKIMPDIVTA